MGEWLWVCSFRFLWGFVEELNVFQQRTNYAIQEYGISLQQMIGLGKPGMRQSQSEAVSAMAISVGIPAILTIVAALYCVIKDQGSRKKCRIAGALFLAVCSFHFDL